MSKAEILDAFKAAGVDPELFKVDRPIEMGGYSDDCFVLDGCRVEGEDAGEYRPYAVVIESESDEPLGVLVSSYEAGGWVTSLVLRKGLVAKAYSVQDEEE